MSTWLVI